VKSSSLLILALASGTLAAQDAPQLDGRFQVFAEMSRPAAIVVAQPSGTNVVDQPKRQVGMGFRFMGELSSAPGYYYELGGMFDASSNFTYNSTYGNFTNAQVTDSYWSLGAAYLAKFGDRMTLGAHLEARGEYLRLSGEVDLPSQAPGQQNASTTYLRPWVRGSFDYTFTGIGQTKHPFIGVDGSIALMKTTQTGTPDFSTGNVDGRSLRALAPKASAALYAGVRF